ncbi:T-cell immune regulator 1, partial [Silurus meridionalis]
MGSMFRSEEVCLVQLFLQSGAAYNCVSELGELGIVEFRDLNPNVNAFQRKFVSEVRRCEELEKAFAFLEQEITRSHSPPLSTPLKGPLLIPPAPQPRELLIIEEESERLTRELREVSRNRDSIRAQLNQLCQYRGVLTQMHFLTSSQVPANLHTRFLASEWLILQKTSYLHENRQDVRLSFVAGVVHPWKVPAFERLLWRACRGYIIVDFREMEEKLEHPESGEMVQWTIFLISYWGDQIGQKVKKICDCFHTQTFPYSESQSEREQVLNEVKTRIEDINKVMKNTEDYLQQLLRRAVTNLPEWRVRVQKCKAIQMVLNLCSPSVTEKCLIAEAWCPVNQLPALQSALREGGRKSGSSVDSFYNRLPPSASPPTLFPTNAFTAGFQNIVDAYGVASYREVNPALYTIITFPFLFAVMFGDVGHGLLMTLAAIWMVIEEKDPKMKNQSNEIWSMMFGGRYLILLMGLFSIYTGAIYNECFSRGLTVFPSSWHVRPHANYYNWTEDTFKSNQYLTLDPNVTGVFTGPYPFGIDPIWGMASNHLTFLNSYKMKMSVIIGIIHMTFGVCLSFFNFLHFREISSVFLVLIPELFFMLCLFGYLIFMVIFKWVAYDSMHSDKAPSILIHFIDMFLFTENKDNQELYSGQMTVQKVLVVLAVCSVPVLLLGKPIHEYLTFKKKKRQAAGDRRPLLAENGSVNAQQDEVDIKVGEEEEEEEFDAANVFMHQAIHTIEYCLGCISNTASYLRLWALSLAHAQLSEVLWVMVMHNSFPYTSYVGGVIMVPVFAFFAVLTISILLIMEGLSAFLHALRLHWVEFQNKFYSGTGYKLSPFSFTSLIS